MSNNYYETDKYIFFWGSCFSQWYKRDMEIDKITYCTAEQYMMVEKARLFGDNDSLEKIMNSKDPSKQKALGRKVKNFDKDKWEKAAREIVFDANYAKFSQHKDLKKQLLETGDKIIVEASPYDKIWGIGMGVDDPDILDSNKWRGTNWLGEEIMKVRDVLKQLNKLTNRTNNIF